MAIIERNVMKRVVRRAIGMGLVATVAWLAIPGGGWAQAAKPASVGAVVQSPTPPDSIARSQRGSVSQRIARTEVSLEYGRPVARGRELYGALVRWGRVWCPGADAATTFTTSTDILINGETLAAGRYSLWTQPQQDQWTVIFSTVATAWHNRYPGARRDALRVTVTPRKGEHMESLAYYFPVVEGREAELVLHWGTTVVPLSLEAP